MVIINSRRRTRRSRLRRPRKFYPSRALTVRRTPERGRYDAWNYGNLNSATLYGGQLGVGISKGDGRGERHGDYITLTGLNVKLMVVPATSNNANNACGYVRCAVLHSKNLTAPVYEKMFDSNTGTDMVPVDFNTSVTDAGRVIMPFNANRWKVLYDKVVPFNLVSTGDCSPKSTLISAYIPMNIRVNYTGDATDSKYCVPNVYWVWFIENEYNAVYTVANYYREHYTLYFRDT